MVDSCLVDAVEFLDPEPRQKRWRSLSYCVLDAVWSIGHDYDSVVVPLVRRVATANGDNAPLISPTQQLLPDPLPLPTLLAKYPDASVLQLLTNKQRTSPRSGILKADAVLRYARILADQGILDLSNAEQLLRDKKALELADTALKLVPGDGVDGVRRGYLWMLVGNDDAIKPDRMVVGWLARQGVNVNAEKARALITEIASELTQRLRRPVTPWMVDHAIWQAERAWRRRLRSYRRTRRRCSQSG